jgi:hypothetical protein
MAVITHDNLSVCTDCTMMIANGELGQGDEAAEAVHVAAMVTLWGEGSAGVMSLVLNCDDDCEGHFSWQRCDGCGSTLGGDRHPAVKFDR